MDAAQTKVLQMVQNGTITAAQAESLLRAMGEDPVPQPQVAAAAVAEPAPPSSRRERRGMPSWWESAWLYVFCGALTLAAVGLGFTIMIGQGQTRPGWLACTLPVLVFGALLAALTWWSRSARWLHIKVREPDQRVHISLPVPLRPAAWALRVARPWVRQLQDTAIDEVLLALADADNQGQEMLVVEVDDAEEGEQVEIRLG